MIKDKSSEGGRAECSLSLSHRMFLQIQTFLTASQEIAEELPEEKSEEIPDVSRLENEEELSDNKEI